MTSNRTIAIILLLLLLPFQANSFSFSLFAGGRGVRCVRDAFGSKHVLGQRSSFPLRALIILPSSPSSSTESSTPPTKLLDSPPVTAVGAAVLDFYSNLDKLYDKSIRIKCPFFRRRAADLIDNAAAVVRFLLIRHKSLPGISDLFLEDDSSSSPPLPSNDHLLPSTSDNDDDPVAVASSTRHHATLMDAVSSPPGCKPLGHRIKRHPDGTSQKSRHLSVYEVTNRIRNDWTGGIHGHGKGYYITGKLDSTIYEDDCLFTGPDPDMPVRGLRKYLSAASQLFDPESSDASLLSISSSQEFYGGGGGGTKGCGAIVEVAWRLGGVIQLPWHPTVEPWTGKTRYHLNEEHLIYWHEETWDISVWRAFLCTLLPEARNWKILWK